MSEDTQRGEAVGRWVAFPRFVNRPLCWKHGHEWGVFPDFGNCHRCGADPMSGMFLALLLAMILGPLIKLKRWLENFR